MTKMTKPEAISRFLTFTSGKDVDTAVWEAMGWPFEGFLRFAQLTEAQADANLANVQAAMLAAGHVPPLPRPYTLKTERDEDPESPDSWENDDIFLVAGHRNLTVRREGFDPRSETLAEDHPEYKVFPLNAYIHGGVSLSLGAFGCPWDSGQVGYVFVSKNGGFTDIDKAAESLVDEWNNYLTGNVWGFTIEDENGEVIESCWGFVDGEDDAREEGQSRLDQLNKERGFVPQQENTP